jgi:hypothetical protein
VSDLQIVDPFAEALEDEPDPYVPTLDDVVADEPPLAVLVEDKSQLTLEDLKALAAQLGVTVVAGDRDAPGNGTEAQPGPPEPHGPPVPEKTKEEKAREHDLALAGGKRESRIQFDSTKADESSETILFHFVEDGLTALNKMWYRGEELEFIITRDADGKPTGSPAYLATLDRDGHSWVHMYDNANEQWKRFGKTLMAPGPWPGNPLPETIPCGHTQDKSWSAESVCRDCGNTGVIHTDKAAEAERKRARRPPVPMDDAIMRGTSSRR